MPESRYPARGDQLVRAGAALPPGDEEGDAGQKVSQPGGLVGPQRDREGRQGGTLVQGYDG